MGLLCSGPCHRFPLPSSIRRKAHALHPASRALVICTTTPPPRARRAPASPLAPEQLKQGLCLASSAPGVQKATFPSLGSLFKSHFLSEALK